MQGIAIWHKVHKLTIGFDTQKQIRTTNWLQDRLGLRLFTSPPHKAGCSTRSFFYVGRIWAHSLGQRFPIDPAYMGSGLSTSPHASLPFSIASPVFLSVWRQFDDSPNHLKWQTGTRSDETKNQPILLARKITQHAFVCFCL